MNRNVLSAMMAVALGSQGCAGEAPAMTAAATSAPPAHAAAAEEKPGAPKLCEHGVPADICTRCSPELAATYKELGDWCGEHGVPESQCLKCNPKLTFASAGAVQGEAWCKDHAAPEAKCTKCRPQLITKFIQAGDYCREHGYPESVCPYCHPDRVKAAGHELPSFPEPGTKVRLASAETERKAGIETASAQERQFAPSIEVVGQIEFDQNRLARLSARSAAVVAEVKVDIGDAVRKGQPLVIFSSGAIGGAQSRLAAARARLQGAEASLEREEALLARGISSKREVEQARTEVAAARADHDGAKAELRAAGAGESGVGGRYALSAPFGGTVVGRDAVAGRAVAEDDVLVEIADLQTMWAVLDVPEEQASSVRPGQRATIRVEGSGEVREGRVGRVAAAVDPRTRTVRVRVDLPNQDGSLKAKTFLRASIALAAPRGSVLVPERAVQRAQGQALVFVRTAPGQYDPVNVVVGGRSGDAIEIVKGLAAGAEVVTTGAFMLKTEILKDSIGAGCADGH